MKVHLLKSTIGAAAPSSARSSSVRSSDGAVERSSSPITETTGVPSSSHSVAATNFAPGPGVTLRTDRPGVSEASIGPPLDPTERPVSTDDKRSCMTDLCVAMH